MQTIPPQPSGSVFRCKPDDTPRGQRVLATLALGIILGGFQWFGFGHVLSIAHIASWLAASVVIVAAIVWACTQNPLLSIGIDDTGVTITHASGVRTFAWAKIEAARFQEYPIANTGGQVITCLLIRARGKTLELTPEFSDEQTRDEFEEAILRELESREIPESSPGLPTFERLLGLVGAWLFVASIVGMLIAHAIGYHTLGTIFGLAMLFSGSAVAWMTRRQRLSQLVLAATAALIIIGSAILWICHVNVREVLQKWEQVEKR